MTVSLDQIIYAGRFRARITVRLALPSGTRNLCRANGVEHSIPRENRHLNFSSAMVVILLLAVVRMTVATLVLPAGWSRRRILFC